MRGHTNLTAMPDRLTKRLAVWHSNRLDPMGLLEAHEPMGFNDNRLLRSAFAQLLRKP